MKVSTGEVNRLLRQRYVDDGMGKWIQVREAASETQGRRCDLICIGAWESMNAKVIGHEVKVSRSDWLREIDDPCKSDAFLPYCNQWYIVAANGIVNLEELPDGWGLMEVLKSGEKLKIRKQAKRNKAKPLTNRMMILWMRNIMKQEDRVIRGRINHEVNIAIERERSQARERSTENHWEKRAKDLEEKIREFEEKSGINIANEWSLGKVSEIVALLRWRGVGGLAERYDWYAKDMEKNLKFYKEQAEEIRKIEKEMKMPEVNKA